MSHATVLIIHALYLTVAEIETCEPARMHIWCSGGKMSSVNVYPTS